MFRENKVKKILSAGDIAIGVASHLPSTAVVELIGLAGYDFDVIDTEHGLYDVDTAGELIRAAHGVGITPIVRVLRNDPGLIMKALDLGAHGVVVPHVTSKEEARQAVRAAKYAPLGVRGSCPYVDAAKFSLAEWKAYQKWSDRETTVTVLIEDEEGVSNIEEILSVKGIDTVWLGPFDLSVGMGLPGDTSHPKVEENLMKVVKACWAKKMPVMCAVSSPEELKSWAAKGARIFSHASDTQILAQSMRSFLRSVDTDRFSRDD